MVIRDDPSLDPAEITACLHRNYGLPTASIAFLPLGFDLSAAVYRVVADDGTAYFLKARSDKVYRPGLLVARALAEAGIGNVVAPLRTRSGALSCRLGARDAVLYPFVEGRSAMAAGMSDDQWCAFGSALRAVHDSGLDERFRDQLPVESFALPSGSLVRETSAHVGSVSPLGTVAARFAEFLRAHDVRIREVLARAESLGQRLRSRSFELVLCHADIHAANILVSAGDAIHLVDWDGPKIAPRERDLLFVVGSTIARPVEPHEEALFFRGYGSIKVDPTALAYYRYERFVEDLGEIAKSVLLDPTLSEEMRAAAVDIAAAYFEPGGFLDRAEVVEHHSR